MDLVQNINTSTVGRKTHFGSSPRSFVFRLEQWSTPIRLYDTSLLHEARSTSAFRGQFIPVQVPPQLVWPVPTAAGTGEGVGKVVFFSTSSQVQLEAADGSGSRPYYLRHSDRTTGETAFSHCWSAPLRTWTGLCLWLLEEAAETGHVSTVFLPYAESNWLLFLKNPFNLLDTTVCFWCTFFRNGCELMSKKVKGKKPHLPALSCVCMRGPRAKGMGFVGPFCPACRASRGGHAPFRS